MSSSVSEVAIGLRARYAMSGTDIAYGVRTVPKVPPSSKLRRVPPKSHRSFPPERRKKNPPEVAQGSWIRGTRPTTGTVVPYLLLAYATALHDRYAMSSTGLGSDVRYSASIRCCVCAMPCPALWLLSTTLRNQIHKNAIAVHSAPGKCVFSLISGAFQAAFGELWGEELRRGGHLTGLSEGLRHAEYNGPDTDYGTTARASTDTCVRYYQVRSRFLAAKTGSYKRPGISLRACYAMSGTDKAMLVRRQ
eukprot:2993379-Rhodomonas_salina.1